MNRPQAKMINFTFWFFLNLNVKALDWSVNAFSASGINHFSFWTAHIIVCADKIILIIPMI